MTMTQAQQAARYFSARRLMRMMRMKQPGNLLVADITTIGRKFSMWLDAEYKIQLVERYTN